MIGFVGLSHLGIVSSIATASKGYEVIAYDPDSALCEGLNHGRWPISEPDLPALLTANQTRIRFTSDVSVLSQCQLIFFSVDIPTDQNNDSDLSSLQGLIDEVVAHVLPDAVLVVLSQVPPGFTRKLAGRLKRIYDDGDSRLFYQVETLIFGRAVERALYPERFIVGCSDSNLTLPKAYTEFLSGFNCPILQMQYESAELAKISINMFLVSSVSMANTMAELCEAIGTDWREIIPALKLDKRIGQYAYLNPGLGIAGGNLERDMMTVRNLASLFGTDAGVIEANLSNSNHRRDWVLKVLHATVMPRCKEPLMAIWGLAYKPNTISTKNSPSLALIEALNQFSVQAYDPQVALSRDKYHNLIEVNSALDACRGADVLMIMTPWREFASINMIELKRLMSGRVIIDPFGALNKQQCTELGFLYFRLGSPTII